MRGLTYRAELLFVSVLAVLVLFAMACGSDDEPIQVVSDVTTDTSTEATVVATSAPIEVPTNPTAIPTVTRVPTATPSPAPTATPVPLFPVTVTGSNGREITFDEAPERIVAIDSAVVGTLFAIGEGWRVVGTHDFVSYPPEAADIERVGGAFNLNFEATVGLDPDLVFVFSEGPVEELERLGLRVLYLQSLSDDFRGVADNVRMWGDIVGNPVSARAGEWWGRTILCRIRPRRRILKGWVAHSTSISRRRWGWIQTWCLCFPRGRWRSWSGWACECCTCRV